MGRSLCNLDFNFLWKSCAALCAPVETLKGQRQFPLIGLKRTTRVMNNVGLLSVCRTRIGPQHLGQQPQKDRRMHFSGSENIPDQNWTTSHESPSGALSGPVMCADCFMASCLWQPELITALIFIFCYSARVHANLKNYQNQSAAPSAGKVT